MDFIEDFKNSIFTINEHNFLESSLAAFDFQYHNNHIYQLYCDSLNKKPNTVKQIEEIPFLPIEFFKNHAVKSTRKSPDKIFKSSGTTGQIRSQHHIADLEFYHTICKHFFESIFGKLANYRIVALLPSYLEQGDSSLISMVDSFMQHSEDGSGYYLNKEIRESVFADQKTILIGVSYALLDFQEMDLDHNAIVIETGGMKGRRKEITRMELHQELGNRLHNSEIWSEYGMTELQSQAYGRNGAFQFPRWAHALVREINDPFTYLVEGRTGGINVIDLANIESCCFIETKDLGKMQNNKTFQVLGRFDNSDVRGCNLLI